ncbi:unnamed protein product [Cunninghamella echinulata]
MEFVSYIFSGYKFKICIGKNFIKISDTHITVNTILQSSDTLFISLINNIEKMINILPNFAKYNQSTKKFEEYFVNHYTSIGSFIDANMNTLSIPVISNIIQWDNNGNIQAQIYELEPDKDLNDLILENLENNNDELLDD